MNINDKRSEMEIAFQRLEKHMKFICPECGETFQTQHHWRQHLNYHHDYLCKSSKDFGFVEVNERYHECQSCKAMVADGKRAIALLQYHRFLHLPYRTYQCRHCPSRFTRKRVLCDHLCRYHEDIVGNIEIETSSSFKDVIPSPRPAARDDPEFYIRYICPQCGKLFDKHSEWLEHVEWKHSRNMRPNFGMQRITGTTNHYCKICRKVVHTSEKSRLLRHSFSHMPYRKFFQCSFCKVRRNLKTEVLHHFIRTHLKEFEKHKHHMCQPVEWGATISEDFSKELDILLQKGSDTLSTKTRLDQANAVRASVSSSNREAARNGMPLSYFTNSLPNNSTDLIQKKLLDSLIDLEKETAPVPVRIVRKEPNEREDQQIISRKQNATPLGLKRRRKENVAAKSNTFKLNLPAKKPSPAKSQLEALCTEIFDEIDKERDSSSIKNCGNPRNQMTIKKNLLETTLEHSRADETGDEVVSIEIDTVDLLELSNTEADNPDLLKEKVTPPAVDKRTNMTSYNSLKSLFHARVLHLCPACGKEFSHQIAWRDHVLTAHENLNCAIEKSFQSLDDKCSNLCLTCMTTVNTTDKAELQRHRFTCCMPFSAYLKCSICASSKPNKAKMLKHLESMHSTLIVPTEDVKHSSTDPEKIEQQQENQLYVFRPRLKSAEYQHLVNHLQKAHDRLEKIAIEEGCLL